MADLTSEPAAEATRARARAVQMRYAPAETRALGVLAILATLAIFWVVLPVGIGVLLGTLLAFATYHSYRPLVRRTRKPALVALGLTATATVGVAGTLGVLAYLLVLQGASALAALPQAFAPGAPGALLAQRLAAPLGLINLQPIAIAERLRGALGGIAGSLAGWAAQAVAIVFDGLLALFFFAITMFFVLRHWGEFARRAQYLMPLNPHHTRRLLRELRRLGRSVVIGNFGTALIQGATAGMGYAIGRVPQAALLGAVTAVASLIPAFGTLLVWVPAGLFMMLGGRWGAGLFVLVWGTLAVIGFCDYVVRPKLLGGGNATSTWMTFVALFGGIKVFGFVGLLLGPLVVGISLESLRLYERVRRFRLNLN